jgi:hypothetical protein
MAKSQSAPSVQPRVYPAGRAVLLFAVGSPELASRRYTIEGRRVQAIRFGRLALLLGYVDQAAYASEELERRRDDLPFLRTEARIHERAVERASALGAVAPVRLLSAFTHPAALEQYARENYARWSRSLTRLGEKRELVVHLFAGPHTPPGGEPYLLRVTARATRSTRAPHFKGDPAIVEHTKALYRACSAAASSTRRVQAASHRGALFSAAYLLAPAGVDALRAALAEQSLAGAALGITAYLEGPRPPFSFA